MKIFEYNISASRHQDPFGQGRPTTFRALWELGTGQAWLLVQCCVMVFASGLRLC
ncbi:MAG: hypothetical protein IJT58_03635 [Synergistaceae bacterium]|nr:hypothetical protein [Synergistaceae bacterium]